MSLTERIGYGWAIGVDPTGSTSFTALGALVEGFKGPAASREKIDVTLLSQLWKVFAAGSADGGETTFTIAWDPGDSTTTTTLTALLSTTSGTVPNWQISYPAYNGGASGTQTFKAILIKFSPEVMKDKMVTSEVTIQTSGNPNFA